MFSPCALFVTSKDKNLHGSDPVIFWTMPLKTELKFNTSSLDTRTYVSDFGGRNAIKPMKTGPGKFQQLGECEYIKCIRFLFVFFCMIWLALSCLVTSNSNTSWFSYFNCTMAEKRQTKPDLDIKKCTTSEFGAWNSNVGSASLRFISGISLILFFICVMRCWKANWHLKVHFSSIISYLGIKSIYVIVIYCVSMFIKSGNSVNHSCNHEQPKFVMSATSTTWKSWQLTSWRWELNNPFIKFAIIKRCLCSMSVLPACTHASSWSKPISICKTQKNHALEMSLPCKCPKLGKMSPRGLDSFGFIHIWLRVNFGFFFGMG